MNRLKGFICRSHSPNKIVLSYLKSDEYVNVYNEKNHLRFESKNKSSNCIIFYPGARIRPEGYALFAYQLAKNGINIIICRFPLHMAILKVNSAHKFINLNSQTKYYLSGHSLGSVAISMYLNKKYNNCIKGLILLNGYSVKDLRRYDIKTLSILCSNDRLLNKKFYNKYRSNLPCLTEKIIKGGNHSKFALLNRLDGDGEAKISFKEQIELTVKIISEWIKDNF